METNIDVLVIGAGPAGSYAAALLEREGFSVAIVEKQRFPRFVIGESLLPRCMDHLARADLLGAVERCNFMVKRGAEIFRGKLHTTFDFKDKFTEGWDYTFQVPRAEFDKALADAVEERGVPILYEHSVERALFAPEGIEVEAKRPDGSSLTFTPRFVLDASGYGRVLPRLLDLDRPSSFPVREALAVHFLGDRRPASPSEGNIWIVSHETYEEVWFWVIPFADGRTSLGVVGTLEFFEQFRGTPAERMRAIIRSDSNIMSRCGAAEFVFEPRTIKGYAAAVKQLYGEGYALVGNAAEFLDPIFSSGVTLALESSAVAVEVLVRQLRGEVVDWQADYADYLMRGVDTFRTYVAAWYDGSLPQIFLSPLRNPDINRCICAILAGYVWDLNNPYVRQPQRSLRLLSELCRPYC